jgi:predicted metal-binding membrane protein
MWRAGTALLFSTSVSGTIYLCGSMRGGMPMPGGWTMSMAWMRMPGQSWLGAAASFMTMWMVMMVAMMLPSLALSLSRLQSGRLAAGSGYFLVWTLIGAVAYALGVIMASTEMRWDALARAVPIVTGVVILFAGLVQLTRWKARLLERCRDTACEGSAWRHGLRFGVQCALCCISFTTILLVTGVMNLLAMAVITMAISVERLAPKPERIARVIGVVVIAAGALVIAQATLSSGR